jgi:hypothetical protein
MSPSSRDLYWSGIPADFRQSGLTHVQFCELRRLSIHFSRAWLYLLRPGMPLGGLAPIALSRWPRAPRSGPPALLPVHVRPRPLEPGIDHPLSRPPAPPRTGPQ